VEVAVKEGSRARADERGTTEETAGAARVTGEATRGEGRYEFVDGVRGFLALWITVCHLIMPFVLTAQKHGIWPDGFTRAVEVVFTGHDRTAMFFVVSGFCLMLPVVKDGAGTLRGGPRGFLLRRGARLLPPYYAVLALVVVGNVVVRLGGGTLEGFSIYGGVDPLRWDGIVSHLLLAHNLKADWMFATYPPVWFVALEWQAYLVFALVLVPAWRFALNRRGTFAAIGTLLAVGAVIGYGVLLLPSPWHLSWTLPHYVFLFAVGGATVAVALARDADGSPTGGLARFRDRTPWATVAGVGLLVLAFLRYRWDLPAWQVDLVIAVVSAACLLQCAREYAAGAESGRRPGAIRRFLEWGPFRWLGVYSYSLFLVHYFVITHWRNGLSGLSLPFAAYALAYWVGSVGLTAAATALFYRYCERPIEALRERARAATGAGRGVPPAEGPDAGAALKA
jgi:peptidoglycan/LPS O-acetylase OafA/YrhL